MRKLVGDQPQRFGRFRIISRRQYYRIVQRQSISGQLPRHLIGRRATIDPHLSRVHAHQRF
jgi:hypothetical protein